MQSARVAERERQRRRRAERRARGTAQRAAREPDPAACHVPASDGISLELHRKVRQSVDRAFDLSRAAFHRLVPKILEDLVRSVAKPGTESRAGR